jgi:pimeloyl-ACP methyl ester carboxylesterase
MTGAGPDYSEHYFQAPDGLRLYYRAYGEPAGDALPAVCLSGLLRNSADFDDLARRLSPARLVLAADYRGRGKSERDPDYRNYRPDVYVQDVIALLQHAGIDRFVSIGTSLGGWLTMALAAALPQRLAGAVLNDIGPDIPREGSDRILGYVGRDERHKTIESAAQAQKDLFLAAFPDFEPSDWEKMARVYYAYDDATGEWRPNYDLAIARALQEQKESAAEIDLWPFFEALKGKPVLAFRGEVSDVLTAETFERMGQVLPDMIRVTVPNRGHVPTLNEPVCVEAIDRFFARL